MSRVKLTLGKAIAPRPTLQPTPLSTLPALPALLVTLLLGFSLPAHAVQDTSTGYQYDPNGNLTQIASPLDTASNPVKTDQLYDSLDRLGTITQPNPVPGGQRPNIFLSHDGQGRLTRVEDPRLLATDYSVDGLGNVTAISSPDSGVATSSYDESGNLTARTDARGKTTTYSYDALGRLTQSTYATGTPTVFTYDGGPGNTNPANIGKLTQMSDEAGLTRYSYDAAGRLTAKAQTLTGTQTTWTTTVSYAYGTSGTALGKPVSITYPSGNRINYGYDAAGRISSVTLNPTNANGIGPNTAVTTVILNSIQYTPTGQFYSGIWGNHTATTWSGIVHTDDVDGRVKAYHLGNPSNGGTLRTLQFDAASRVAGMAHTGTGTGVFAPANFNQGFSYGNLGRLTAYTSATGGQSYRYDATGNRIGTDSYTHNIDQGSNRLLSTTGPVPAKTNTYDAAGNLLSDGTTSYAYSDRGRLKSVTKAAVTTNYAYNGLGQRVKKVGSGSGQSSIIQYAYDGQGHLLGEYDFYAKPAQETVYLGEMPIAVVTQTATTTGPGSVTVDNTDTANVTAVGSWPAATTIAGFQGSNYQAHVATATTTDSFTWRVNIPVPGKYWFQARWTADATRSGTATYTITGADGVTIKAVDQRSGGNTWTPLGAKTITAPGVVTVQLSAASNGTVSADAVQALPGVVATKANYVFADHLDTPRVITRATDNKMVWRWDQADPFGVLQPNENPASLSVFTYNPRFPGQLYDAETGLYYNYHRHYDPKTDTYTQSDPIGLAGGINSYAYVNNNPINLIDPLGLWSVSVSAYAGLGGGVSITGTGFQFDSVTFEAGVGVGRGFSYNPFGGKPDENAPPNSNSIGFASGAAIGLGPVSIGRGWNYGATQSCTRNWNGYGGNDPEYSAGRSSGGFPVRVGGFNLEAEARIAFQLTHNF
jgi:RHS repeat-associated protein